MAILIPGTAAAELLFGSEENDIIYTNGGADTVWGFGGNDTLVQRGGSSVLYGGLGNDVYIVVDGAINISEFGGGGIDTLRTFVGMTSDLADGVENIENLLYSNALTLRGNALNNQIICGTASDTVFGRAGNDLIVGSQFNPSTLHGEGDNDRLIGGNSAGADSLDGGPGNDVLEGRAGPDALDGGAGNDTYVLAADTTDTITDASGVDTITSTVTRFIAAFSTIENLTLLGAANIAGVGNALANSIVGNAGANSLAGLVNNDVLSGLGGNDIMDGGANNDRLLGGTGNDSLTGGAGNDTFVFNTAPNATLDRDIIKDFNHAADTIQLDNAVFATLGANGALNPAFFRIGAAAADANDHIIYNPATGALFYDLNGNAAGGSVLFAVLLGTPAILANDFVVI